MVLIIENDNHSHFIKEFVRLEDGRSRRYGGIKRVVEKRCEDYSCVSHEK